MRLLAEVGLCWKVKDVLVGNANIKKIMFAQEGMVDMEKEQLAELGNFYEIHG